MNTHWDNINKWLHFGQFILTFNNWLNWLPNTNHYPIIREFTLFQIMWDNGAFWGYDLNNTKIIEKPTMNKENIEIEKYTEKSGTSQRFIQIILLGIGLRYNYQKTMTISYKIKNNM